MFNIKLLDRKNFFLYFLITTIFLILFLSQSTRIPIDSDEITWSIIGRRVFAGEDFHKFFLGQKYMGAIEGYIVGLFQIIFGYNTFTLRINSLIFGILTALSCFLILKKYYGLLAGIFTFIVFTFFMSSDIAFNFVKAYGNRPFISFVGLLSIFLSYEIYIKQKLKNLEIYALLNGLLLGLAFWANLEALSFFVFNILFFVLGLVLKRDSFSKPKIKLDIRLLINFLFLANLFVLLFLLFLKKPLINPYLTVVTKISPSATFLSFLDINFSQKEVVLIFYVLSILKILFFKSKNKIINLFTISTFAFALGAYFNFAYISIARSAGESISLSDSFKFTFGPVLNHFLGASVYDKTIISTVVRFCSVLLFPLGFSIYSLIIILKAIKNKKPSFDFTNLLFVYLSIPFLFAFSKPAAANESARFFTSMWPGFALLWCLGFIRLFKTRGILPKALSIYLLVFYFLHFSFFPNFVKTIRNKVPESEAILASNYLMSNGIKTCYAGYWNAYPIMFKSKYKVICSPSEQYGYGVNETPFYSELVDKDRNPAFIFTTEKRVNYYKENLENKKFKTLDYKDIGIYKIILTERVD